MGEKTIKPVGGDRVVTPPPEIPRSVEKGGGSEVGRTEASMPVTEEEFAEQLAQSAEQAKKGVHDTLYKDGWYEGKDEKGRIYAQDPQGVRGYWDPEKKRFVDTNLGFPMPKDWGTQHKPK